MTEGRTEGRTEKERRATRLTPVQTPWLDSGLPRSAHAAIARSHLHQHCSLSGGYGVIVCICCKALYCAQKWSDSH